MIRWNWNPKRVVFCDLETASAVDLRDKGSFAYAQHLSTRLLSAVFRVPGKLPIVWVPFAPRGLTYPGLVTGEGVPPSVTKLLATHTLVAHNAEGFDALVWEGLYPGTSPQWLDTLPLAKCMGLPASLDSLARRLGVEVKSDIGKRAMMLLTKAGVQKGRYTYPVGTLPLWRKLLDYNVRDVETLERVYAAVSPALAYHARDLALHSRVNDAGVRVDRALANKLKSLWTRVKRDAGDEVSELTNGELSRITIRSNPSVHAWLRRRGVNLSTLRREEVDAILADPDVLGEVEDESLALVTEVLRLRSVITRTAEAKLDRLLDSCYGDTLRYAHVFHGATTGRFSSRGVQVHNLPRGDSDLNVEGALRKLSLKSLGSRPVDALNTLLRPVFVGDFSILDFGAVEARGVAWLAGEESLLESFRDPTRDVYCDFGAGLFGREIGKSDKRERQVSKIIVLGAGYGMGIARFATLCKSSGIDLGAVELSARDCITTYRASYPAIVRLWADLEAAAFSAMRGKRCEGLVGFKRERDDLLLTLPSGRTIYYRDAKVTLEPPFWARLRGVSAPAVDTLSYSHPHGYRKTLYGGLLCENAVQAICRDLLVDAMHRVKGAIRLHVHDEIVVEGDLEQAAKAMSRAPSWAKGFPVLVEGFTCGRYVKSPFKGSEHARAINGKTF